MQSKKWIYKSVDPKKTKELSEQYKISRLTATVLQNRMEIFYPEGKKPVEGNCPMYDPYLLLDMDKAVERIQKAISGGEHITIYGDYDADGVTSTTILYLFLKDEGAVVDYYIPDRVDEGYGIKLPALEKIKENGASLIITVDTGVTAIEEAKVLREMGMDLIITDHHECKAEVPECCAVIDPKREGCPYPFKQLAGVGVVFKLLSAIGGEERKQELIEKYLPYVCLGTIADVAPLVDENRAFVKFGLRYLHNSKGIQALLAVTNLLDKEVTAGNIGFIVAPRINAAGRLGSANKSVELFLCDDEKRALKVAQELSDENRHRQEMEAEILKDAVEIIEKNNLHTQKVIVVAKEGWHHGVIGIVSSKITEKYSRPSILISITGNEGKGSGRSIGSFSLFDALTHCGELLSQFGGHSLAAGLTIEKDQIPEFRKQINQYADSILKPEDFVPPLYIDAKLSKYDLNINTVENLKTLEPYGMGNPSPVFVLQQSKIKLITSFSNERHLKMLLQKDGAIIEAIGFNMGGLNGIFNVYDTIDVAGTLDINNFRGERKIQIILKDIRYYSK